MNDAYEYFQAYFNIQYDDVSRFVNTWIHIPVKSVCGLVVVVVDGGALPISSKPIKMAYLFKFCLEKNFETPDVLKSAHETVDYV